MTIAAASRAPRSQALIAALAVMLGGAATILGAYFFQYVLGLPPCPLCLDQRVPYYIAIPLAAALAVVVRRGAAPAWLAQAGFAVIAAAMLAGAGLGLYHAGVEWGWWAGPTDCSGPVAGLGSAADLLSRIEASRVVRCDEAAWRFLGLSLAGYNVLISLALAAIAGCGLVAARRAA